MHQQSRIHPTIRGGEPTRAEYGQDLRLTVIRDKVRDKVLPEYQDRHRLQMCTATIHRMPCKHTPPVPGRGHEHSTQILCALHPHLRSAYPPTRPHRVTLHMQRKVLGQRTLMKETSTHIGQVSKMESNTKDREKLSRNARVSRKGSRLNAPC